MGPVVAGDLISLGLRGGQEKKAARARLSPERPGATLAGPGMGLPFSPWGKSLQVIVYLVLERMAFLLLSSSSLPFQVLNHFMPPSNQLLSATSETGRLATAV